jgi:hypothetical protein
MDAMGGANGRPGNSPTLAVYHYFHHEAERDLLLIGVMLVAEGIEKHIEHGYIYFAMAFSFFVEILNLRLRTPASPV